MGPPVFHKWFMEHFNTTVDMLEARRLYASSLGVMSIIGNIIGKSRNDVLIAIQ